MTHVSSPLPVVNAGRWLLAFVATVVAGVAAMAALVALLLSGDAGHTPLAIAACLGVMSLAALATGRRARPARSSREEFVELPSPDLDDYSGLPSVPPEATGAPFALATAGVSLIVTVVLFPVGLFFALGAAFAGEPVGVILAGLGIGATGPILLASAWIFRR